MSKVFLNKEKTGRKLFRLSSNLKYFLKIFIQGKTIDFYNIRDWHKLFLVS